MLAGAVESDFAADLARVVSYSTGLQQSLDMQAIKHRLSMGLSPTTIAHELGVSRGTVYKAKAEMKDIA